jgi:phenylalanyl-tRNA synthetase alpha chain
VTAAPQPPPDAGGPAPLTETLRNLEAQGTERLAAAGTLEELAAAEAELVGKRSALAGLNAGLAGLQPDERRRAGAEINAVRTALVERAGRRRADLAATERAARLASEQADLTELALLEADGAGAGPRVRGHLHLVTQTREELEDIFVALGFSVAEGPEAETDWYNFEALNMPPAHPARSMWDTLYLDLGEPGSVLLRTHCSPVQVHLMEEQPPPIYAVMPGRCYRQETPDARHLAVFHQIEGLVVDEGITFGDLAGTIEAFTTAYFGAGMRSRLRPSYFPFTEPSAEFDVTCPTCAGAGCRTCSGSGWIELGGCGLVDPNVFAAVGIDAERYSGFAFGFGIDRLAMIRTGLSDIRALLDNDVRFLHQF